MKKQLFALLLMLMSATGMAQSDISIILNTPFDGSTVTSGVHFDLNYEVMNSGNNVIFTGDSIFLGISIADQIVDGSTKYILLTQDLEIGESTGNLGSMETSLSFSGLEGEAELCVIAAYGPVNLSYTEADEDKANNTSCTSMFFTGGANVGIEEQRNNLSIVYPNPASSHINFKIALAYTVRIYDLTGRELKTVRFNDNELKRVGLEELSNGIYIYQAYDANGDLLEQDKFQLVK